MGTPTGRSCRFGVRDSANFFLSGLTGGIKELLSTTRLETVAAGNSGRAAGSSLTSEQWMKAARM
jgi:hypothetical protein